MEELIVIFIKSGWALGISLIVQLVIWVGLLLFIHEIKDYLSDKVYNALGGITYGGSGYASYCVMDFIMN